MTLHRVILNGDSAGRSDSLTEPFLPFFRIGFLWPQLEHLFDDFVEESDSSPLLASGSLNCTDFFLGFLGVEASEAATEVVAELLETRISTPVDHLSVHLDRAYSVSVSPQLSVCSTRTVVVRVLVRTFLPTAASALRNFFSKPGPMMYLNSLEFSILYT